MYTKNPEYSTIRITKQTKMELADMKDEPESYEKVIKRLIRESKPSIKKFVGLQ